MTFLALLLAMVLVSSAMTATPAMALPATCLTTPFPTTPIPPTYQMTPHGVLGMALWRQPCQDGSGQTVALIRITPLTSGPFLCSIDFHIIQNGQQLQGRIAPFPGQSFCGDLFITTTFALVESGQPPFDASQAFTLIYQTPAIGQLQVPALSPTPSPPTITVVATGCTTCHPGNTVGYNAQITNPGGPMLVEIKGGLRLPDGQILGLVSQEMTIPSGSSTVAIIPSMPTPGGLPAIDLIVEAALLEPELGATLSRHSVTLHLVP